MKWTKYEHDEVFLNMIFFQEFKKYDGQRTLYERLKFLFLSYLVRIE